MLLAISSYSCRVRGCKEVWVIVDDGSFDDVMRNIESVPEMCRDAHEISAHADDQWEELTYDYTR